MTETLNNILGLLGASGIIGTVVVFLLNKKKYNTEVKKETIQNKRDEASYIDEAIEKTTNTNGNLLLKIESITSDYLEISRKYIEIQQKYNEIFESFKTYSCVVPACPQRILYKMQQVIDHTIEQPTITHDNKE